MNLELLSTSDELAEKAASFIADVMSQAVRERGRFLIALSGGNTPRPAYERLAAEPYGAALPWDKTEIFFGDERMVPCDNKESNFRMACDALLDHISIPPWCIHRIEGQTQPTVAAERYDRQLRALGSEGHPPRFDLILLGLGPDGHTASLFPGAEVLENQIDFAAAVRLPNSSEGVEHAQDRVTMTYPVINSARQILFLVSGSDKKEALARVERDDRSAPAARVDAANARWLVVSS